MNATISPARRASSWLSWSAILLGLVSSVLGFAAARFRLALVLAFVALACALAARRWQSPPRWLSATSIIVAAIACGLILARAWLPDDAQRELAEWWSRVTDSGGR